MLEVVPDVKFYATHPCTLMTWRRGASRNPTFQLLLKWVLHVYVILEM